MKKILLWFFGGIILLVLISNWYNSIPTVRVSAPAPPGVSESIASEAKGSREAAQRILSQCRKVFNENFPYDNEIEWDWESKKLTVYLWPSFFGAREANAALKDIKYLNQWNDGLHSLQEIAQEIQQEYEEKGFPEASVRIHLYDNADPSLLLASVSSASIEYDAVESTPAGQYIGQTVDTRSLAENTYVLNTSTKVFHLPGCSAVSQMSSEHKMSVTDTRDELIAQGYTSCGKCHP